MDGEPKTTAERLASLAGFMKQIEAYQLASGMVTQDELDTEDARLQINERIKNPSPMFEKFPQNRVSRRAQARRARRK